MRVPAWFPHDVSRETLEKLSAYSDQLRKWTKHINLISKSSIDDIENRHIWDSSQIFRPEKGCWVDIGSGGGLPGIVIAILAQQHQNPKDIVLIESDQRKSTFLRTCIRELELSAKVISERIEDAAPQNAIVISARALTGLNDLLALSVRHLAPDGNCTFLKGARWRSEIEQAERNWRFSWEAVQSKTNPEAAVLNIKDIRRV